MCLPLFFLCLHTRCVSICVFTHADCGAYVSAAPALISYT